MDRWIVIEGTPFPFGASWVESGKAYNFSLYSKSATRVILLLYSENDPVQPLHRFPLDHLRNKTGRIWHCRIPAAEIKGVAYYAYSIDGPFDPAEGQRFDKTKVLMDPYAKAIGGRDVWGEKPDWNNMYQHRARVCFDDFDWENDHPLETPVEDLVNAAAFYAHYAWTA